MFPPPSPSSLAASSRAFPPFPSVPFPSYVLDPSCHLNAATAARQPSCFSQHEQSSLEKKAPGNGLTPNGLTHATTTWTIKQRHI